MSRFSDKTVQRLILAAVVLGSFMGATDSSIVIISLTTLSRYFDAGTSQVSWVLMAYLLVMTGFLIPFGRLGDMTGRKRIFVSGFAVFTASSFLCGTAVDLPALVLFRVLQGIGGAMITATGPALLSVSLPEKVRGRALGCLSASNALGLAAGFGLGAVIIHLLSWRWIFFINVPVGLCALVLAYLFIPCDAGEPGVREAFDLPGALLVLAAVGLFVSALSFGEEAGWTSLPILVALVLSSIFSVVFVARELRTPEPLLQFRLLKKPGVSLGIGAAMLNRLVLSGITFLIPMYLELVKGYSTGFTGLLLLAPSLLIIVAGPVSGTLSDRIGSRWLCTLADVLLFVSVSLFLVFDETIPLTFILLALVLRSISMGLFPPPNLRFILTSTPAEQRGSASAFWYFSRYLSSTIGIAVFETVFDHGIRAGGSAGMTGAVHLLHTAAELETAFDHAFLIGSAFVVGMILMTAMMRESKTERE